MEIRNHALQDKIAVSLLPLRRLLPNAGECQQVFNQSLHAQRAVNWVVNVLVGVLVNLSLVALG
jgi:hypothetical protein